ncbi:MAG: anti-sigma factor [Gaiellaceae bacterium]
MSVMRTTAVCERTREQVSLSLDGELSQLERRLLAAHLARCTECNAYAADVRSFTGRMRQAPLEPLRQPVVVRRQRRLSPGRIQVVAAAALAFLAVGIAGQLSSTSAEQPTSSRFGLAPNLSPPGAVLEREQAILRVVRPGTTLPPPGSVL